MKTTTTKVTKEIKQEFNLESENDTKNRIFA